MDTKQTKTIGEHHAASELARRGWAPALTRDGLERTDILAVRANPDNRRMVEIQVKTARGSSWRSISWPLGSKSQGPSQHQREYFVMVAVLHDLTLQPRNFVVPRSHVAAAAWIEHMNWLTHPGIEPGKRNAPVERSRVLLSTFERYEDRWDLLLVDESERRCCYLNASGALRRRSASGCPGGTPGMRCCPTGDSPANRRGVGDSSRSVIRGHGNVGVEEMVDGCRVARSVVAGLWSPQRAKVHDREGAAPVAIA